MYLKVASAFISLLIRYFQFEIKIKKSKTKSRIKDFLPVLKDLISVLIEILKF